MAAEIEKAPEDAWVAASRSFELLDCLASAHRSGLRLSLGRVHAVGQQGEEEAMYIGGGVLAVIIIIILLIWLL